MNTNQAKVVVPNIDEMSKEGQEILNQFQAPHLTYTRQVLELIQKSETYIIKVTNAGLDIAKRLEVAEQVNKDNVALIDRLRNDVFKLTSELNDYREQNKAVEVEDVNDAPLLGKSK